MPDIIAELVVILFAMSHVITIVLRGVGTITWSWWIILMPELFMAAGLVELSILMLISVRRHARRNRGKGR